MRGWGARWRSTLIRFEMNPALFLFPTGLAFCAVLVVFTLTDLEQRIIPNRVVAAGAVAGIVIAAVGDPGSLPERLTAAAVGGGILFLIALAYPRGLGMGDAKLVGMMGIYLGSALAP